MKVSEIIQAWYNKGFADEDIQLIAKERMEICNSCPSKKKILGVDVCGECYCPLSGKTFSPINSCPLKKWKN